ncbi:hypothetical protein KGF54_004527 [Candida jiufengensis]|uniref:uncharacterized protein n=1 Tax=Candida jiufengensis TaxID=497108 RepID=UPI002224FD06|nr:uncharacterized protein KGF54_004527 [Candida jiufengensis]KAI5951453.1 hypothetical protein KGF54_004527 [Candida jiufengensis]
MSDFAFNNYCIQCDQLCPTNSVYCSENCKNKEIQSSIQELKKQRDLSYSSNPYNKYQHNHTHSSVSSESSTSSNSSTELVSPLLTPALYLQQQQQLFNNSQLSISSPLLLSQSDELTEESDLNYFDLNYSINSNINYTTTNTKTSSNNNNNEELINSTSHNYRKWLTAL